MTDLGNLAWPEVPHLPTVLVPVGSTEQHGPHLPFDTDTAIACATSELVANLLPKAIVTPPIAFGSSGEHQSFPGTVSIGTEALLLMLVELVRSLSTWAGRVVLVNAHGGNIEALTAAVSQLRSELHHVAWVACATEHFDLHAGFTETSLMLHLRPDSVRLDRAEPGDTRPLAEILTALRSDGLAAITANGVLGNPTGASAAAGAQILDSLVDDVAARIQQGQLGMNGALTLTSTAAAVS